MLTLTGNQDWIIENMKTAAAGSKAPLWLQSGIIPADDRHEAVLFLKPEVGMAGPGKLPAFLKLIDSLCTKFDVEIMNIGAISWDYMSQYGIINDHYGVIGKLAAEGMSALTSDVQAKLRDMFGVTDEQVFGALQFLDAKKNWDAETLGVLWENLNSTHTQKLAPGTYAQKIVYQSDTYVLLEGFYPQMAAHFTSKGRNILVMPIRSKTGWEKLRNEMIGDTDPTKAVAGSYRATVLAEKDAMGLPVVNKGLNGIHMSAGPLEGMVELIRFTSDRTTNAMLKPEQTNFGTAFMAAGGSATELNNLCDNPLVTANGKTQSAFDATEVMDMNDAIATLRTALKQAA
jgi:hypothetical protein